MVGSTGFGRFPDQTSEGGGLIFSRLPMMAMIRRNMMMVRRSIGRTMLKKEILAFFACEFESFF